MDNFAFSIRQASPTNDSGYQNHLAPVVVGAGTHFDTSLAANGDASLLVCGGNQVYNQLAHHAHTQVEHCQWPGVRSCSPMSANSTGSLPTTPISLSCGDQMAAGLGSGYDTVTQNQAAYPGFGEDAGHAHEREYDYISLSTSASRRSSDNNNNDLNNNGCFVSSYPQTYQVQSYTPQLSLSLPPSMPMPVQIPVSVPDYLPSKQLDNNNVYATNLKVNVDPSELDECHVQVRRTSQHEPEHSREDMEFAMFMASLPSYQL